MSLIRMFASVPVRPLRILVTKSKTILLAGIVSRYCVHNPLSNSPIVSAHQVRPTQPMGWTSENVAEDFNITREQMDELACLSHNRAEAAQRAGLFKDEIAPVQVRSSDGKSIVVSEDDTIRKGTTIEALAKIRSAFPQFGKGQTTGGNASQITDGGAAVLLMKRRKANQLGLR
jgi:acetyl-CoA acyltransferase 1